MLLCIVGDIVYLHDASFGHSGVASCSTGCFNPNVGLKLVKQSPTVCEGAACYEAESVHVGKSAGRIIRTAG